MIYIFSEIPFYLDVPKKQMYTEPKDGDAQG